MQLAVENGNKYHYATTTGHANLAEIKIFLRIPDFRLRTIYQELFFVPKEKKPDNYFTHSLAGLDTQTTTTQGCFNKHMHTMTLNKM